MKKLLLLSALFILACSSNEAVLQDNITLNSFNRNPAPLYILDGVITSTLDSITPSSIAEIYILKGEKATDKYGQKAKHGVVEVITKKATTKP
jgi:outer membrane receptor protein involved in Fe transport